MLAWNTAFLPNAKRPSLKKLLGDEPAQAPARGGANDIRLAMAQWRVAMAGVHRRPPPQPAIRKVTRHTRKEG